MLRGYLGRKSNKGSLTVEACIALPVFLCFFYLLLFFVKIACINITLDHAVKETAQQLAAVTYPVSYVNEYIDREVAKGKVFENFFAKEFKKVQDFHDRKVKETIITRIMTGEFAEIDVAKNIEEMGQIINKDLNTGLQGLVMQALLPPITELKEVGQYELAQKILNGYLANSKIQQEKLSLNLVELPQGCAEYQLKKDRAWYQGIGLVPDEDFARDDVVIQLEYKFKIPLPFFGQKEVLLRHTAVEKAWLKGSNGVYTGSKKDEKLKLPALCKGNDPEKKDQDVEVYVCKSDTPVYHTRPDCDYLGSQITIMTLEEAEKKGKRPHKGCPFRFK